MHVYRPTLDYPDQWNGERSSQQWHDVPQLNSGDDRALIQSRKRGIVRGYYLTGTG
jgi:hypothetical protein